MSEDHGKIQDQGFGFEFRRPGSFSQGTRRNLLIFLVLSILTLSNAFESTSLSVAISALARDLNSSISETFSFTTSFLLCMTLVQPLFSEISWVAGRRPAFSLAILLFVAGTIMCGCAQSSIVLLLGRGIQGAGAGATDSVKTLILFDLFDLRQRSKWIAYLNVSWTVGTVAGPMLGGVFVQSKLTWRWIFWINIPFLVLGLVGSVWLLGYDDRPKWSWKLFRWIDWGGMALFVFSGGLILISLSWAGSRYPWRSPLVVTFLAVGVFILPILGYWENSRAAKPIFPPSVFRQYSTAIHLFNVLLHGLLMWLLLHYLSLYYIAIKGLSPVQAGLWALPAILMVAPIAILVGLVVAWTGHYYAFLVGGWCLATASFLCLSLVNQESRMLSLIGITMLAGISFGALVPGMSVAIQATVNRADAGHAICMTLLMRPAGQALGIALGLTVFSAIFENKLESFGLVTLGTPTSIMRFLTHSDIMGPEIAAAMDALSGVWIMGGVVAFVAMVLTTTAKYPRLLPDGEDGTDHDEERIEMLPLRVQRNDEETGGGQDDDGVGSEDDGSRSRLVSDEGSGSAPMGEVQAPRPIAIRLR